MAPPMGGQDPQDVLAAVRRLEAELDALRSRARQAAPEVAGLRAQLADDRRAAVEDLTRILDVLGASWRSTQAQIQAVRRDVDGLRRAVEETRDLFAGATVEIRLREPSAANGVPPARARTPY